MNELMIAPLELNNTVNLSKMSTNISSLALLLDLLTVHWIAFDETTFLDNIEGLKFEVCCCEIITGVFTM